MYLTFSILEDLLGICRMEKERQIPNWALNGSFVSITITPDELSIVCSQEHVPQNVKCEKGWRALKAAGPLEFSLTGILATIATILADAGISIFALSTYDTDYILVKEPDLEKSVLALTSKGHKVISKC